MPQYLRAQMRQKSRLVAHVDPLVARHVKIAAAATGMTISALTEKALATEIQRLREEAARQLRAEGKPSTAKGRTNIGGGGLANALLFGIRPTGSA